MNRFTFTKTNKFLFGFKDTTWAVLEAGGKKVPLVIPWGFVETNRSSRVCGIDTQTRERHPFVFINNKLAFLFIYLFIYPFTGALSGNASDDLMLPSALP